MNDQELKYTIGDSCSFDELLLFMQQVDSDFVPPLLQRIDVNMYIDKIRTKASIHTCRSNGTIVGMIALYENNLETKEAFITYLEVAKQWRKLKIASTLLSLSGINAKKNQMQVLKVSTCNPNAKCFYESNSFTLYQTEYDAKCNMERYYLEKEL